MNKFVLWICASKNIVNMNVKKMYKRYTMLVFLNVNSVIIMTYTLTKRVALIEKLLTWVKISTSQSIVLEFGPQRTLS